MPASSTPPPSAAFRRGAGCRKFAGRALSQHSGDVMTEYARKYISSGFAGALVLAAMQLAAAAASAGDYDVGSIHITQPWARATPKGASSGAGYLTVTNNGTAVDRLNCAGSDAAAQCQIHTMTM